MELRDAACPTDHSSTNTIEWNQLGKADEINVHTSRDFQVDFKCCKIIDEIKFIIFVQWKLTQKQASKASQLSFGMITWLLRISNLKAVTCAQNLTYGIDVQMICEKEKIIAYTAQQSL